MNLDHIINWKLRAGSHEFPGPDGGTCINEAAIVAAGFEYRSVRSHQDCPPCFCPVLSEFAIAVNDCLDDWTRNALLMPLVTRLSGSKDERAWVEDARLRFMARELQRDVFEPIRRFAGSRGVFEPLVLDGEDRTRELLGAVVRAFKTLRAVGPIFWYDTLQLRGPLEYDVTVPEAVNRRALSATDVWPLAARALSRAFEIGAMAPESDTKAVVERMEAAKLAAEITPQLAELSS